MNPITNQEREWKDVGASNIRNLLTALIQKDFPRKITVEEKREVVNISLKLLYEILKFYHRFF
jgi:hypothetical protein